MFLIADGFLDTFKNSVLGKFFPALVGLLGAILLGYGCVQIFRGITSQQSRGQHLGWGGVSFVIGAFFLGGSVIPFLQREGKGSAQDIGLN